MRSSKVVGNFKLPELRETSEIDSRWNCFQIKYFALWKYMWEEKILTSIQPCLFKTHSAAGHFQSDVEQVNHEVS